MSPFPSLNPIMKPQSIALVGASTKEHTIGSDILKRLTEYGFTGNLYPVNPKADAIGGLKAYASVKDIEGPVDLAIIVINAKHVLSVIDECHEKGVGGLCVISAGFKESGAAGATLEAELLKKCRAYKMRCIGPNCLGVVNTHPSIRMDGCFAETLPERGDIGFVSQSGALGGGILNILKDLNIGFAQFISIGNQADVNATTAIEYWENDDDVGQILLYMESIPNPAAFRKAAERVSKKKPILALKAGRSEAGASAASSHTGSLAGSDKAADALLKQCGVIRETSLQSLFATAKVFSRSQLPAGNRIAVITNSGGPGIMAADAVSAHGLTVARLSEQTQSALREFLPAVASVKNPVDMIASAPLEHYEKTLDTVLSDPGVDAALVIYLPFLGLKDTAVAQAVCRAKEKHPDKPLIGVFMTDNTFFSTLSDVKPNVPFFMYAEEAVDALAQLCRQSEWVKKPAGCVPSFEFDTDQIQSIFESLKQQGREELTTQESLDVMASCGIRVCRAKLAATEQEALSAAREIGYPIVMKMVSETTSHKTDVGGVRVNITDEAMLRREYADLMEKLKEKNLLVGLKGVLIQEQVRGRREMVCGLSVDPQYGPLMMFGLGGIFVEVLKDITFRVVPLTDADAKDMVRSVRSYSLLKGARGTTPAKIEQIEETLLRLSQLAYEYPQVCELDINPLMISETTGEAVAVDARIRLAK